MKALYLDNDWEAEYSLTRRNADSGATEVATGLTGLSCRISLTPDGPAVHADLNLSMAERSGALGTYVVVFDGDKLRTRLAVYVGRTVYEVFGDGANVLTAVARRVRGRRFPT